MKCLWGCKQNTLLNRRNSSFAKFTMRHCCRCCLSIFLTNAHKLVFRFYHQKCTTTINPHHVLKTKGTFARLFFFPSSILANFFFFILVFCCNCCRWCHYGSDYMWSGSHLVNSLIFHLPSDSFASRWIHSATPKIITDPKEEKFTMNFLVRSGWPPFDAICCGQ